MAFVCLIAWPISYFVSVQVRQFSVSVQNLFQHLSKIYLKVFTYQNLLKSQNLLKFPGIFGSSGHFLGSSGHSAEVPNFFRKFRTLNFFKSYSAYPFVPYLSKIFFSAASAPNTPFSPSQASHLQTLTLNLKSPEVPQIPGSLDSSG